MPRITRAALIQASLCEKADAPLDKIKKAMIDKHIAMIEHAAKQGARIVCLQEIFFGPYFCAEQETRWYSLTEPIPDGPTTRLFQDVARKNNIIIVLPIYEVDLPGLYYNTAAVIDEHGKYLGKYRKHHIPHCKPGFWEKFYFAPGNLRHFPEGARELGLNGAEILFNPSATVAGLSEYLWKLEQPAHAVANQYFVAAINRVGTEAPWNIGEFYGQSYFCNPRGQIIAQASRDKDETLIADLDLDLIQEVRNTWQFFRDRRPESYTKIAECR